MGLVCFSPVIRLVLTLFHGSDQFCSLIFSLSNIYLVVCVYSGGLDEHWNRCLSPRPWGVPFVLASLPLLVRLVQSVKRWVDSRLVTHLINVSILVLPHSVPCADGSPGWKIWRRCDLLPCILQLETSWYVRRFKFCIDLTHVPQGGSRGGEFALFIIFGVIYALYASAWVSSHPISLIVDAYPQTVPGLPYGLVVATPTCKVSTIARGSIVHRQNSGMSKRYIALTGRVSCIGDSFTILRWYAKFDATQSFRLIHHIQVSNVLIRFIWVLYIPEKGPSFAARTVIAALLEMLRRWQWNFCAFMIRWYTPTQFADICYA